MKSLPKTIRVIKIALLLMRRVQIYLENKTDCPGLKDDLEHALRQLEQFVSPE